MSLGVTAQNESEIASPVVRSATVEADVNAGYR